VNIALILANAAPGAAGEFLGFALGFPLGSLMFFIGPAWLINVIARAKVVNGWTGAYVFCMIFGPLNLLAGCAALLTGVPTQGPMLLAGAVGVMFGKMCKGMAEQFNRERQHLKRRPQQPTSSPAFPSVAGSPGHVSHSSLPPKPGPDLTSTAQPNHLGTALSFVIALALAGGLGMVGSALMSESKAGAEKPALEKKDSADFRAEAEAAFVEGKFTSAATFAEAALGELKAESASESEIIACKEYVARCQYKAKLYESACLSYGYLVKKRPSDKQLAQTSQLVRREYWEKELKPKLKLAEKHRANERFGPARDLAKEVRELCRRAGLDTSGADALLASVDKSERAFTNRSVTRNREHHLNKVIPVQIGSPLTGGRVEKMSRREYLRRKELERQGRSWEKQPNMGTSTQPSADAYPKANPARNRRAQPASRW